MALGKTAVVSHLYLVTPSNENRSVTNQPARSGPVRRANADLRPREYLTKAEVEKLIKAARNGQGRYGDRDATLILIAFRHGLRAIEICDLEWAQVEFGRSPSLHVRRAKNGKPSIHPLRGDEVRALRKLHRKTTSNFVFETERDGPFTPDAVNRLIKRIGERASFGFTVYAHSYAAPRLRVRTGECGARYARYSGLAWASVNSAYRALYRADADAVQGFLAR